MKRIGLVGGIGPESTAEYYKLIIGAFHDRQAELGYPEIVIYSGDLTSLLRMLHADDWQGLTAWLVEKVRALHRAGAELAAICSNTPHAVFDQVQRSSPIPLLSIIDATVETAQGLRLGRVGLLGTKFTMTSDLYRAPLEARGIEVVVPAPAEQDLVQERLFSEIELGVIKDSTRQELLAIVGRMIEARGIEGVILGCTELPLILPQDELGIRFINTTAIHAARIVRGCLEAE